jgi:hypothetical protein
MFSDVSLSLIPPLHKGNFLLEELIVMKKIPLPICTVMNSFATKTTDSHVAFLMTSLDISKVHCFQLKVCTVLYKFFICSVPQLFSTSDPFLSTF